MRLLLLDELTLEGPAGGVDGIPGAVTELTYAGKSVAVRRAEVAPRAAPDATSGLHTFLRVCPGEGDPGVPPLGVSTGTRRTSDTLYALVGTGTAEVPTAPAPALRDFDAGVHSLFPTYLQGH